jgi:hypothetical protein
VSNLRDRAKTADSLVDWEFLNPAWGGTRARPSDIDGEIEQNYHWLTLEGKRVGHRWNLDDAQFRTLKHKSELPEFCVMVLYVENPWAPTVRFVEVVAPGMPHHRELRAATNADVIAWCNLWWNHTRCCRDAHLCPHNMTDFVE